MVVGVEEWEVWLVVVAAVFEKRKKPIVPAGKEGVDVVAPEEQTLSAAAEK